MFCYPLNLLTFPFLVLFHLPCYNPFWAHCVPSLQPTRIVSHQSSPNRPPATTTISNSISSLDVRRKHDMWSPPQTGGPKLKTTSNLLTLGVVTTIRLYIEREREMTNVRKAVIGTKWRVDGASERCLVPRCCKEARDRKSKERADKCLEKRFCVWSSSMWGTLVNLGGG